MSLSEGRQQPRGSLAGSRSSSAARARAARLCSVAAQGPRLQLQTLECAQLIPRPWLHAALPFLRGQAPHL